MSKPRDLNFWEIKNVSIIVDFAEKSVSLASLFLTFGRFHLFEILLEWSNIILVVEGRDYDNIFLAFNNEGLQR